MLPRVCQKVAAMVGVGWGGGEVEVEVEKGRKGAAVCALTPHRQSRGHVVSQVLPKHLLDGVNVGGGEALAFNGQRGNGATPPATTAAAATAAAA